jgi:hypothetical protein
MGFLIGTVVAALLVTLAAAKLIAVRRPGMSYGMHVILAAMSFPVLAILLFVIATVFTLAQPTLPEPGGAAGMVVFAFVFFLFYAVAIGGVIGLPTAFIAVRSLRR